MSNRSGTEFFLRILGRRKALALALGILSLALGAFAGRVRPDFSIEMMFPRFDRSRVDYERYKQSFPLDDAQAALVVEAPDLFTPAGLGRVAALERDLAAIPGVIDTQGLTTVQDISLDADGESLQVEKLFPQPDLPPEELARRRATATTDPLFAWNLATPDGRATIIRVTLTREQAAKDALRTEFLRRAREVVARHAATARAAGVAQDIVLTGLPVIRSEYTELINRDLGLLFPLAFVLVLLLLYLSLRKLADIGAAVVTILVSVVWTVGVMGILGVPLQVLTQITPIIVMIISISDTVHVVVHFREELRAGRSVPQAIAVACADSAMPCLLTELTIAIGFLGLIGTDMIMIQQFGLVTAPGMLLTWLANFTVLPLMLSFIRPGAAAAPVSSGDGAAARWFNRFLAAIEHAITRRPAAVLLSAAAIVVVAGALGTRAGREYYSYDDLRPDSPLARNIRQLEATHGGSVPFAIFIEPKQPVAPGAEAMLDPAALALIDRITTKLEREFPNDIKNAMSLSKYLRKAHGLFAGPDAPSPLPTTRGLAAQELLAIDDPKALRDVLAFDRNSATILAMMPDRGSSRSTELITKLNQYFAEEMRGGPYRITITGIYGLADGIYRSMVGGLARSLAVAIGITFIVFCGVLRSLRLALIALVPNLVPLVFTLGTMSLLGIDIKPSTVIIFSITLVIADDDTIQYLTRFRRSYLELKSAGHPDPHREAALGTLRGTGLPMFTTSCAISFGFLALLFSQFLGLANLGLLIGVSLFAAVFADLFLAPLLIMKIRPKL